MATILIVDDRPTNRQFLTTLLSYGGHRLLEAADGAEALKLVREEHPDLVISDILMPTMDGFEFAKRVRADAVIAHTKIVFYTATYRAQEARILADACGVTTVIAKPAEPQLVLDIVSRQLGAEPDKPVLPAGSRSKTAPVTDELELADLGVQLTDYVNDLRGVKAQLDGLVERGLELEQERERLQHVSARFAQNVTELHLTSSRLFTLVELGMDLASERDPKRLLELFTAAARRLLDASAGVALFLHPDEERIQHLASNGLGSAAAQALASLRPREGLVGEVLSTHRVVRASASEGQSLLGLPAGLDAFKNFLGITIGLPSGRYGVAFFAGKAGATAFSLDDEKLAQALAAQLAAMYENFELYDKLQRHATELQLEVKRRQEAEAGILRLNRLYSVLSGINESVVRSRDQADLFAGVCGTAVERGRFLSAAILLHDAAAERLEVVSHAGQDLHRFGNHVLCTRIGSSDSATCAVRALQEKRIVFEVDLRDRPDAPSFRREVIQAGVRSVVALPLSSGETPIGVMVLLAGEEGVFDDDEMKLLEELSADVAYALDYLEQSSRARFLALHDPLTGLPNRRQFAERLEAMVAGASRAQPSVGVAILDINRFSMVNDSLGKAAGDELLKAVGCRFAEVFALRGVAARVGGNAFAVAMLGRWDAGAAARDAARFYDELFTEPFRVAGQELRISATVGVALYPADGATPDVLMGNAEVALKRGKKSAERIVFYGREMNAQVSENLALESRLRRAVERREFVLYYQPKVDARSRAVVGLEALIRWNDPEKGIVPPGLFIPLLEETGLILEVGQWALGEAVANIRAWRSAGAVVPRVAVNVSTIQFKQPDFVDGVLAALEQFGEAEPVLDLEITESLVMEDIDRTVRTMQILKGVGVHTAIDDFGTGYCSLGYVAKLPVNALKIDRSFVIGMAESAYSRNIVSMIVSLAHSIGVEIIAEGVDAEDQAETLVALGCEQMQGYLFSRPVPAADVPRLLAAPCARERVGAMH